MKYSSPYRRSLSAVLLMLYIFIAAPVQLWHHHRPVSKAAVSELQSYKKAAVDLQTQECKICQHTYTASINDAAVIKHSTQLLYAGVNADLYFHYHFIAAASADNKSPPVV